MPSKTLVSTFASLERNSLFLQIWPFSQTGVLVEDLCSISAFCRAASMSAAQGVVLHILCKTDHRGEHVIIRSQEQTWTHTHKATGCKEKALVLHFSACKNTPFSYLSSKRRNVALCLGLLKTAVPTIISFLCVWPCLQCILFTGVFCNYLSSSL